MNKSIRFILALGVIFLTTTSCKTKQKVAQIPAGAKITATTPAPSKLASPAAPMTQEKVQNENFSLVDGEKDVLKNKYHVVVGSFKKQDNAKELQKVLNSQGNKSTIVLNATGMYRVLIASFNDYTKAHEKIKEIADQYADAWVLVQQ